MRRPEEDAVGRAEGKVAFITGAARGQGRAHAVRLAQEGADIIALDICADTASIDYPNATPGDLEETVRLVEKQGRRILARTADVRDGSAVQRVLDDGLAELGRVDIVLANAGIIRLTETTEHEQVWQDIIGTNLTGVWHTVTAALPAMIEAGRGGSVILTSSTAGIRPTASLVTGSLAYTASKFALVGMAKQLAAALAKHSIRVNTIHPTGVASGMTLNDAMGQLFAAAMDNGDTAVLDATRNAMDVALLEPEDIANTVAFLVSDEARYITGVSLPVDAGFSVR
jgi:SDR family mycofactocin-dependent oxidoreductase